MKSHGLQTPSCLRMTRQTTSDNKYTNLIQVGGGLENLPAHACKPTTWLMITLPSCDRSAHHLPDQSHSPKVCGPVRPPPSTSPCTLQAAQSGTWRYGFNNQAVGGTSGAGCGTTYGNGGAVSGGTTITAIPAWNDATNTAGTAIYEVGELTGNELAPWYAGIMALSLCPVMSSDGACWLMLHI
jgi:hypothetical protein